MAVRRAAAWTAMGQGSFFLLNFAGSVVIARLLGPFDMGVFAVAMATVGIVQMIQTMGLDALLVSEDELDPEVVATAQTVNLALAFLTAAVIAIVGIAGGRLFHEPKVRDVLMVVAIVPSLLPPRPI